MSLVLPIATDPQNNPSHSRLHRVFACDGSAPDQSITIDAAGNGVCVGTWSAEMIKIPQIGGTAGKFNIFKGGANIIDLTYTLPTAYPSVSGYVLSSTDAGVMSWVEGGGLTEAQADLRYLKLDGSNGPLTGDLSLGAYSLTAVNITATNSLGLDSATSSDLYIDRGSNTLNREAALDWITNGVYQFRMGLLAAHNGSDDYLTLTDGVGGVLLDIHKATPNVFDFQAGSITTTGTITGNNLATPHYTLPHVDGNANYILKTDGSGTVSWAEASGGWVGTATSDLDMDGNDIVNAQSIEIEHASSAQLNFQITGGSASGIYWDGTDLAVASIMRPYSSHYNLGTATDYWGTSYIETMLADHIGEKTSSHTVVFDNALDMGTNNITGIGTLDFNSASTGWSTANYSSDTALDGSSYTIGEVVDVLCTLIEALKGLGILES